MALTPDPTTIDCPDCTDGGIITVADCTRCGGTRWVEQSAHAAWLAEADRLTEEGDPAAFFLWALEHPSPLLDGQPRTGSVVADRRINFIENMEWTLRRWAGRRVRIEASDTPDTAGSRQVWTVTGTVVGVAGMIAEPGNARTNLLTAVLDTTSGLVTVHVRNIIAIDQA